MSFDYYQPRYGHKDYIRPLNLVYPCGCDKHSITLNEVLQCFLEGRFLSIYRDQFVVAKGFVYHIETQTIVVFQTEYLILVHPIFKKLSSTIFGKLKRKYNCLFFTTQLLDNKLGSRSKVNELFNEWIKVYTNTQE